MNGSTHQRTNPPLWAIWRNPIVRRYGTARLRPVRVAAWTLVVQAFAAFLWLIVFFTTRKLEGSSYAAFMAWTPILILQGVLWLMKGTFSVAVGIAREGAEGLTESQRLTPLSAWHKVIGYLCGLPILETVLVASLLPWAAVSVVMGKVPLLVVFRVYLLLTTSAVLHHSIGLVAGTVIRQKIVAGTVSQLLVIGLHFIVPLFARFGLGPLGHLGVETAIMQELLPLKLKHSLLEPVRFFDYTVTLTGYQWVVMSVLIAFLLQILRRRWKRADSHLLSKPLTVAFSAWIIVMSLGELFPLLRDGTLFDWTKRAVSQSRKGAGLTALTEGLIPLGWAAALGCVALVSAMVWSAIITPTLEQHVGGKRARLGTGGARLPWAGDARSALAWTATLGLMALAGWTVLVDHLLGTPMLHLVLRPERGMPLTLGAGLLIPLLTWAVLLEWRGFKIACLWAFVGWVIPLMVAIVGMIAGANVTHWPKWSLAISGFALPVFSMSQSLSGLADATGVARQLYWPWLVSLGGHATLAVAMFFYLQRAQRLDAKAPAGT